MPLIQWAHTKIVHYICAWHLCISGCSKPYNTKLGSHTNDLLSISTTETIVYVYSGRTLKLYITFVPIIRTSKHFWLLQCIWHQTMVIYPWCITTCSHWNHCIWSQELWEHKFLVFKNGLLFYRFMVEWVSFLHKMTFKGLIAIINQTILTINQP